MAPKHNMKSFFRTVLHRPPPTIKIRNIKPRDAGKPSLATLNQDVATLVIRCLYDMDPDSVHDVALVCSELYVWARYVQHQHIYVNLARDHALDQLQSISRNGFLPAVRELYIKVDDRVKPPVDNVRDPPPKFRDDRKRLKRQVDAWHLLCNLIPQMSGLSHLHWKGAVLPDPVLEHLDKNPHTRLHLTIKHRTETRSGANHHQEQLALLERLAVNISKSPNLSSLEIKLENNTSEYARDMMQGPFKQLLVSSPALRSLSLRIGERQDGCVVGLLDPENCSFGLVNGEAPRNPLQELEIGGYHWGMPRHAATVTRMEYWRRTLDWSQLRRLVLHDRTEIQYRSLQLAEFLAPHLVALEEIELGESLEENCPQVISNFFNLLASRKLTSISLPFLIPPSPSPTATLTAHAATLQSLTIHPSPLTSQEIIFVRDSFPQLMTLSLVCDRDYTTNSWPYETLSLVASMPRLRRLTVWFDLGPDEAPFKPYLTISSAGDLFSHLRRQGASKLELLHLHSGFPPPPLRGFYALEAEWQFDRPSSFVCKTTEDIHTDSGYQVSCTKLTRAQNERLRRDAAMGGESTSKQDANNIKYRVALKGPMTPSERSAWRDYQRERAQKASWYRLI